MNWEALATSREMAYNQRQGKSKCADDERVPIRVFIGGLAKRLLHACLGSRLQPSIWRGVNGLSIFPGTWLTPEDARSLIEQYVDHYNTVRLHSAIGFVTSADMLAGRQKEIQARYSGIGKRFMILSRCPDLPLTPYVECVWHYECAAPLQCSERVLADARFQLMVNLGAGIGAVSGLRSHHIVIDTARVSSAIGVVFRPGAARAFVAAPAVDFCDQAIQLDLIWGRRSADQLLDRLRETRTPEARMRIVEEALVDRMQTFREKHLPMHPVLNHALHAFGATPHMRTVADVSREIGWSRRWLSQAFAEQVGITPKRYCRLVRFQHLVRELASERSVDWAGVALAGGFCDQAHLVHEFRAFSGLSPETFLKSERPFPNHVRVG